jgi:hypothetical protein
MIWALLLGAAPLDPIGAPLQFYLSDVDAGAVIKAVEGPLGGCEVPGDLNVGLTVVLKAEGGMSVHRIDGAEASLSACIGQVFSAAESPPHAGIDVCVDTTLYVRGGVVLLSPRPTVHRRLLGPLMLFVPGDQAVRSRVSQHLEGPSPQED